MDFWLPYQKYLILDQARFIIVEKSRRVGISLACAYKIFIERITAKRNAIICSADFKTSKSFLADIKRFAQATNVILGEEFVKEGDITSEAIVMPNGSKIIAVSSSPTAFRGLGGDVVLDEFAFSQCQEELYAAAAPLADWNNGKIFIISTHNGEGTIFNQMVKKSRNKEINYKLYRLTLADAVEQGLAEKITGEHSKIPDRAERNKAYIQSIRDRSLSELMFKQEYCCETLSASSIVSPDQYDKCIMKNYIPSRDKWNIDLSKHNWIDIGVDIGRSGDSTVLYAIEQSEDTKQTNPKLKRIYVSVLCKIITNMPFDAQYQLLCGYINHPKIRKVLVENNGVGMQIAEQLENTFPGKVHGYHATSNSKAIAIERLAGFIAQERISLPPDADIREDILSMKRIVSDSGRIAYDGHSSLGHCDVFTALSLSLHAAENESTFFEIGKI